MLLKKSFSLFMCAALMLSLCVFALPGTARAATDDVTHYINNGSIKVEKDGDNRWKVTNVNTSAVIASRKSMTDTLIIKGDKNANNGENPFIMIDNVGSVNAPFLLELNDATIVNGIGSNGGVIGLLNRSHVKLTLTGVSALTSEGNSATLRVGALSDLTITGNGTLTASSMDEAGAGKAAAIGGAHGEACGHVTIDSGVVTAWADRGAAIGGGGTDIGGTGGSGGSITINGGAVTATSSYGAAIGGGGFGNTGTAIGNGNGGMGGSITVNGGTVIATSTYGAAIGGGGVYGNGDGDGGVGGSITVNGGTVTATSSHGAAIGGGGVRYGSGSGGAGGSLYMSGGVLSAQSTNGAAIGGGKNNSGSYGANTTVTFDGSYAYAWSRDGSDYERKTDNKPYENDNGTQKYIRPEKQYAVSVTPATHIFDARTVGYTTPPAAQTFTVKNVGYDSITDFSMSYSTSDLKFDIVPFPQNTLAKNSDTATFTVRPKLGLAASDTSYSVDIDITRSLNRLASVNPTFKVNAAPTVTLSANPVPVVSGQTCTLTAATTGGTDPYRYSWDNGATWVSTATKNVSPLTTTVYTVKVKDGCDVEAVSNACTVTVSPAITTTVLPDGAVNTDYTQPLQATGDPVITWSKDAGALPDGLSLTTSGSITGTPTTPGTFNFTVKATNSYGTAIQPLSIHIDALPVRPDVTTTALSDGVVGTGYSQTLHAAGTAPITWSVESGALPAGLTIGSDGVISGAPTAAGTSSFTVKAANNWGYDTKLLSVTINPAPVAPDITTATLPNGTVNTTYTPQTLQATGAAPITWSLSSGSLPDGLILNPSTGEITGTPTTAGEYNFTVTAANAVGSDAKRFTVYIGTALIRGVVSEGGVPVAGAKVEIRDASNTLIAAVTTGSDGSYTLEGLTPGNAYTITAEKNGHTARQTVQVTSTETTANIALPVSTVPGGSVHSSAGGTIDRSGLFAGTWQNGVLTVQANCENFVSVTLDGVLLTKDKDYTVKCGSTIITFTQSCLAGLKDGSHAIRVQFTNGQYSDTFMTPLGMAVSIVPEVPATGDAPLWAKALSLLFG